MLSLVLRIPRRNPGHTRGRHHRHLTIITTIPLLHRLITGLLLPTITTQAHHRESGTDLLGCCSEQE
jgi:hypothetical protein